MSIFRKVIVIAVLHFCVFPVSAQGILKGLITDAKTNEPLPFAEVVVKQSGEHIQNCQTDFDGFFILNLTKGVYDIDVSSWGYKRDIRYSIQVQDTGSSIIDFQLTPIVIKQNSQSELHYYGTDVKFKSFINLFNTIPETDTIPIIHNIHIAPYPQSYIDSDYYNFVNKIPFFKPVATFKIVCENGVLVCVRHYSPMDWSDLQFIELLSFNNQGEQINRLAFPYLKVGCISTYDTDNECWTTLFVSNKEVMIKLVQYDRRKDVLVNHIYRYKIDSKGVPILISESDNASERNK